MASVLAPVMQSLRDRGLFYYRRARVVRCDNLDDAEESGIGLDVREASEEDLRKLAGLQGSAEPEWLAKRARGIVCLAARSGPEYLGYLWITRSPEAMTEVNQVLDVSRDAAGAYMFDGYVFPAHRRKGVLRTLLNASKRWAAQRGIARLYAAFARENRASERALRHAGFVTIVGDVGIVRVLDREWNWIRFPHGMPTVDVLKAADPPRSGSRAK